MKPNYTFHSHTYRCGHAEGDMEDYIKEAIKKGYSFLGVSDHVFLKDIYQPTIRGNFSLLDEYIETYRKCEEKYKDKIKTYLAFECEYIPRFMEYYKSLLTCRKFDYLLLGQHMTFDENNKAIGYFWYDHLDNIYGIRKYKDDLIEGMKSGLFLYAAHPDLFMYTVRKITLEIKEIFNEIVDTSIKYDIPLELNIGGYTRIEADEIYGTIGYPCKEFWKIAKDKGAKILFGGDYHAIEQMNNERFFELLSQFIDDLKLELYDPNKAFEEYRKRISKLQN